MQILTINQVDNVSCGELKCTAGTSGVNCAGTLSDWGQAAESVAGFLHDTGEWWGGHIYEWIN